MAKVCFYTPYDRISGGELGSDHTQLTTDYELTDNPDGPGFICKVTEHSVTMGNHGHINVDWTITYTGELEELNA